LGGTLANQVPNKFAPSGLNKGTVGFINDPTSAAYTAQASANAFQAGYNSGFTLAQLQNAVLPATFSTPSISSFPSTFHAPHTLEWSFEIQRQLSTHNIASLTYVGNHGYDLTNRNLKVNGNATNGFGGLPVTAPDPRFRIITDLTNSGISNYDGLTVSYRRAFGFGFQGQIGYTFSHALDTISNGGLTLFFSADALTSQNDAFNQRRLNYSNADYDIRHVVVSDFVWEIPFKSGNKMMNNIIGGWSLANKAFIRSGTPFSVINSRIPGQLSASLGGNVLATLIAPTNTVCGPSAVNTPCLSASSFATTNQQIALGSFGNLPRNSFRAPGYVDFDTSLYKTFVIHERARFLIGASAFNIANHPNFTNPSASAAPASLGSFGKIFNTVTDPREIQFALKLYF